MKNRDRLELIIAVAIFGTIGIIRRYIPLPSSVIAMVRGFIGAIFLLLIHFCKKEHFDKQLLKKNMVLLCVSGAFLGANWIFLFEAYRYTTVSVATMAYYMAPVFVMLVSPLCLHEKITIKKTVCTLVALFGMVLVSGVLESSVTGLKGVLLGLGAAVMYAGVTILNKFIKGLPSIDRTIFQLGAGAIAVLPYVLLTENLAELKFNAFIIIMLLVAGVVQTGIAFACYFGSLKTLPAQTAALLSYIDPIVAVILSVVVLKESMSLFAAIGAVLVIGAMVICEVNTNKKEKNLLN